MSNRQIRCGLALLLLPLGGCAVLTRPKALFRVHHPAAVNSGYHDYAGVIHVHTTYSHDADGTFEDVVRVANAQGLHFVITTEHNNLQALRDGLQGWHGNVLILVGMEISTKSGHYVAMNVTEEVDRLNLTAQQVIDEVNRQGGLGFIAHPYFKKARWSNWSVTGFTGIEGYNVAHDTLDENKPRLALWTLTAPVEPFFYSILDRPYDPLSTWDHLISLHGRVVGIGASDAHEFHALGLRFAPYEVMFLMSRTHLLIPSETLTPELIYDALRAGHAYFSIELVAEAEGFVFEARKDQTLAGIMGDEVSLSPDLRLAVSVPTAARLVLFKDGTPIAQITGQTWDVPVTEPGVYRLEASRQNKPWIFSNPIYVRPAPEVPKPVTEPPVPPAETVPADSAVPAPSDVPAAAPQ